MRHGFLSHTQQQNSEVIVIMSTIKLKKEYFYVAACVLAVLAVFVLGNAREVIKGKRVSVVVRDASGADIPSLKVFAEFSQLDKIALLRNDISDKAQWSRERVLINKIIIAVTSADIPRISAIDVSIGEKDFHFTDIQQWVQIQDFDLSVVQKYFKNEEHESYIFFAAPSEVSLRKLSLPFKKDLFEGNINLGGGIEILVQLFTLSVHAIVAFLILLGSTGLILLRFAGYRGAIVRSGDEIDVYKRKFVVFFLTIILTVGALLCINLLIIHFYKPDLERILGRLSSLILDFYIPDSLPEPVERLQFELSVLLAPFVLILSYVILKKRCIGRVWVDTIYPMLATTTVFLVFGFTYLALMKSNFLYIKSSYFFDSYGRYIFNIVIFPTLFFLFITRGQKTISTSRFIHAFATHVPKIVLCLTIFLIAIINIIGVDSIFLHYHFNPIFYPVAQVVAGKSPLVDLPSLYGLFPLFLVPAFSVVGLSVVSFSFVMGIFASFAFLFLFLFMSRVIRDRVLLYAGFLCVLFYSYLGHPYFAHPLNPEIYFQYWPVRFLFPCLFLFLVSVYLHTNNRRLYYLSFVVYALGMLWNLDSGVVVFLAWLVVLAYNEFTQDTLTYFKMARHLLVAFASLFAIIFSFCTWIYVSSGSWPDFSMVWLYQKINLDGFYALPMPPPPHMWAVIALVYLCGLLFILSKSLDHKKIFYEDKLIFAVTILGVGLLTYYQGRSHDRTLVLPSYAAFILIAIFVDRLYQYIKTIGGALYGEMLMFILLFYVVISAPFNIAYNIETYFSYVRSGMESFMNEGNSPYAHNINFIKKHTSRGEGVVVLSINKEGIYYGETGTYSAIDVPALTDPILKQDTEQIVDFLNYDESTKVFVEGPLNAFDLYDVRIKQVLEARYSIATSSAHDLSWYVYK